ncbi:inorganic pyrophosphatase [Lachnospiraceae bacterium oral taxon 500]|nr:inorganic pyrophosphatase [Lachnospiraceae bacterium oral taxon 500]
MNIWHDIKPERVTPDKFIAVVEISGGSKVKYEMDKATGLLRMDRVLYTATHYPANYGFLPLTYANDKDPLDVLVLASVNFVPMSMVECYPIGVVIMEDEGYRDEKIIAIPFTDPTYSSFQKIEDLPAHIMKELLHFFEVYKTLEGKATAIGSVEGKDAAKEIIRQALAEYWQLRSEGKLG